MSREGEARNAVRIGDQPATSASPMRVISLPGPELVDIGLVLAESSQRVDPSDQKPNARFSLADQLRQRSAPSRVRRLNTYERLRLDTHVRWPGTRVAASCS